MADQPATGEKPTQPAVSAAAEPVKAAAPAPDGKTVDPQAAKPADAAKPVVDPAKPAADAAKPAEVAKPAEPGKQTEPAKEPTAEEAAAAAAANVVPEVYTLKRADGTPVDSALIEAVTPVLKEAGMTAGQAQTLVDNFNAYQKALLPQVMQRDLESLKADPELGQLNFARTQSRVNDALAVFTTPEERTALTAMGLANNPTLVRMFHRIGAAMQEAPETPSGPRVRGKAPTSKKLYGGADLVASKAN